MKEKKKSKMLIIIVSIIIILIITFAFILLSKDKTEDSNQNKDVHQSSESNLNNASNITVEDEVENEQDNIIEILPFEQLYADVVPQELSDLWPLKNYNLNDFGQLIEIGINSQYDVDFYTIFCVYQRDEDLDTLKEIFDDIVIGEWTYSEYSGHDVYGGTIEDLESATCSITPFVSTDAYTGSRVFIAFSFKADSKIIDNFLDAHWPTNFYPEQTATNEESLFFNSIKYKLNDSITLGRSWSTSSNEIFNGINEGLKNLEGYNYTEATEYSGENTKCLIDGIQFELSYQESMSEMSISLTKEY